MKLDRQPRYSGYIGGASFADLLLVWAVYY